MVERIVVSDTLAVFVQAGDDPRIWVDRTNGGLVTVRPSEMRHLVAALSEAAGLLAEREAARAEVLAAAGRMGRQIVEARRLRRKRLDENGERGA